MEGLQTPRRHRNLPNGEQQRQRRTRMMCSCCSAKAMAAQDDLGTLRSPAAKMQSRERSGRADSPADSPPDSPRRTLAASPPVAMRLQLDTETPSGVTGRRHAYPAPLPLRPPRQQQREQRPAAPSVAQATTWSPLPFRIEPHPGESRNEAIVRVMDHRVPEPTTPTAGIDGVWNGPLCFGKLTTVVDKYVYNQPWDRVIAAYHWRWHADLDGDMHATQLPLQPADAQGTHMIQYNVSIDMPRIVKVVARCDAYRWTERQNIDVAARCFRSYSSTEMWRDKFHSLEFIEIFAVSETETYMRKGLIADTSATFPPRWVCDWIAKTYSQRSNESCHVLDKIAAAIDERQPGSEPRSEHPDVVQIRSHLELPPLSKRVKQPRPLWVDPGGYSGK